MLLSMLTASAHDFEYNGMYFNILSTTDLTCEITEGDVKYEGNISIPSEVEYKGRTLKVTSIGQSAFSNSSSLVSVNIPNSVTSIGRHAFYECSSLASVTIPNSVTSIGDAAFRYCYSLASVTLPNSVTKIGSCTFEYCSSLASVTIPNSVIYIEDWAFSGCSSLVSVTIPNSVTKISNSVFSDCSSLVSVTIPNSVKEIYNGAFNGCSSLLSVTIPNSVEKIHVWCFANCSKLQKIEIEKGDNPLKLDEKIFENDDAVTDIVIGRKMVWYDRNYNETYDFWIRFKTILCLENITSLTFLCDIDIDNFFGYNDFSTTLINLTIGNNVKNYPENLREYSKLQTITLKDPVPQRCPSFVAKQYTDMTIYVPKGSLASYQGAKGWKNFWDIRESEESGIDDAAVVDEKVEIGRYDLQGRRVGEDYRGMVIVRFSDGSVRKTIVR